MERRQASALQVRLDEPEVLVGAAGDFCEHVGGGLVAQAVTRVRECFCLLRQDRKRFCNDPREFVGIGDRRAANEAGADDGYGLALLHAGEIGQRLS